MITSKMSAMASILMLTSFPLTATANEDTKNGKNISLKSTPTNAPQQQSSRLIESKLIQKSVLSSNTPKIRANGYTVRDTKGETYTNHILSTEELSPVKTKVQFSESYNIQYNGITYQNNVVKSDSR